MRVLQIMADGSPGGGPTHLLQILPGLNQTYSFGVITQIDSYLETECRALGIPTFGIEFFRSRIDPSIVIRMRQIIGQFQPDLVHAHGSRAGFAYLMSGLKIPMVYTIHGHHFPHKNLLLKWLAIKAERQIGRLARHVVFVSRHDLAKAETENLLTADTPRTVIYCGIRFDDIPATNAAEQTTVGFIGRLVEQKDPLLFLDCVELLPRHEATIVGGGKLEKKVKAEVAKRGLSNVTTLGSLSRRETLQALSKFAVLVITSRWEGLPILALEAMCAGVPVVAADVGGIAEAIEDQRSGVLVRNRSASEFAKAVKQLTEDRNFRDLIIGAARNRVRQLFSREKMLQEIWQVYERCVDCAPTGAATGCLC